MSSSEEELPQLSVRPGVCRRNGEEPNEFASSECRLTSSECDGQVFGLEFISGMDQWNKPGPYASCPSQTALWAIEVGRCNSDGNTDVCAPNEESCGDSNNFVGPDSLDNPDDCIVGTTKFGSCGGGECRWSPEHCPPSTNNNDAWTFPNDDCTCDKVRVGACVNTMHNDFVICAVDEEACNPDISYYVPVDRVAEEFGISCSLCRGTFETPINDNNDNSNIENTDVQSNSNAGQRSGISAGGVAGALVAGCVVFVAAVVGAAYVYRWKHPPPKKKKKLPATVVSNAQLEEDDVSVL